MLLSKLKPISQIFAVRYTFSMAEFEQIPKPWNIKHTKEQKKLLSNPLINPFPKYIADFNDTLHIPGLEGSTLFSMYEEFIETKETPLSSHFIGFMLYNFSKNGYLNPLTWSKLQPYIGRNRGQYRARSIFGCLYACIRYGSQKNIQFFVEEMVGQKLTFTDLQAIQIVQAFNLTSYPYTQQFKYQFWDKYFKPHFSLSIKEGVRIHKLSTVFRIFDALAKFEYYHDVQLWNLIFSWMERRKGWKRTEIIQRLYPLTGTFEKAKQIFDGYYHELSVNPHIIWRYNLEELRLYSSEEMIAKSQNDIKMNPSDRTLVKRQDQARFTAEYHQWLTDGARQKDAQLIKDKAQSLAFAIKDRYDSLKKDKVDFSKLSTEQFQDLFGVYDPSLMYKPKTIQPQDLQEQPQETPQIQEQKEKPKKKKK